MIKKTKVFCHKDTCKHNVLKTCTKDAITMNWIGPAACYDFELKLIAKDVKKDGETNDRGLQ